VKGSWYIIAGEYFHGMKLLAWVWYKVADDGLLKGIESHALHQHSHSINQYSYSVSHPCGIQYQQQAGGNSLYERNNSKSKSIKRAEQSLSFRIVQTATHIVFNTVPSPCCYSGFPALRIPACRIPAHIFSYRCLEFNWFGLGKVRA
jgi:hypothetical protein